jgi:hypothetical protein
MSGILKNIMFPTLDPFPSSDEKVGRTYEYYDGSGRQS